MTILTSLFVALAFFVLAVLVENYLNHGEIITQEGEFVLIGNLRAIRPYRYQQIALVAITLGSANFATAKITAVGFNAVLFVAVLAILAATMKWFIRDADRLRELICFIPLPIIIAYVLRNIGRTIAAGVYSGRGGEIASHTVPLLALIVGLIAPAMVYAFRRIGSTATTESEYFVLYGAIILLTGLLVCGSAYALAPLITPAPTDVQASEEAYAVTDADFEDLTVRKLTVEELEALTIEKYSEISEKLLRSSLLPNDSERTRKSGFSDALTFGFDSNDKNQMFKELQ